MHIPVSNTNHKTTLSVNKQEIRSMIYITILFIDRSILKLNTLSKNFKSIILRQI